MISMKSFVHFVLFGLVLSATAHAQDIEPKYKTPDTNNAWPALLAARLRANKATANIGVVNEGIGGNRLLTDL